MPNAPEREVMFLLWQPSTPNSAVFQCIQEEDKWKKALSTTCGHSEFCVIPYGLSSRADQGGPVLVSGPGSALCKMGKNLNYMCNFKVAFLGYIIEPEGVLMDKDKVSDI